MATGLFLLASGSATRPDGGGDGEAGSESEMQRRMDALGDIFRREDDEVISASHAQ